MKKSEHKKLSPEEKREIRRKTARVIGARLKYYMSIQSKGSRENENIIEKEKK